MFIAISQKCRGVSEALQVDSGRRAIVVSNPNGQILKGGQEQNGELGERPAASGFCANLD